MIAHLGEVLDVLARYEQTAQNVWQRNCVFSAGVRNRLVRQRNCGHARDVYGTVILSERKWKLNAGPVNDPGGSSTAPNCKGRLWVLRPRARHLAEHWTRLRTYCTPSLTIITSSSLDNQESILKSKSYGRHEISSALRGNLSNAHTVTECFSIVLFLIFYRNIVITVGSF